MKHICLSILIGLALLYEKMIISSSNATDTNNTVGQLSQEKLQSCLRLTSLVTKRQSKKFDEVIQTMMKFSHGDAMEKSEKFTSMLLLLCYDKITIEQGIKLNQTKENDIHLNSTEIEDLLLFDVIHKLYQSNNVKGIKQLHQKLKGIMKQLSSEEKTALNPNFDNMFKYKPNRYGKFANDLNILSKENKSMLGIGLLIIVIIIFVIVISMTFKMNEPKKKKKNN